MRSMVFYHAFQKYDKNSQKALMDQLDDPNRPSFPSFMNSNSVNAHCTRSLSIPIFFIRNRSAINYNSKL